jgi:hypothetical protein
MTFWFSSRIENHTYSIFEKCWNVCERTIFSRISRSVFFFQAWNRLSRIYNKRKRHNNKFEQNKHHYKLIDDQIFKNIQIFLNFVYFYRRFIVRFSQLSTFSSNMLKKMQAKIKKEFFLFIEKTKQIFDLF